MGLGVDLEEAARPADYYDIFADPRDDEAPPVWGYRAPGCWSRMSVEDRHLHPNPNSDAPCDGAVFRRLHLHGGPQPSLLRRR
nr:unnamed protein product [Digitaria exilis]